MAADIILVERRRASVCLSIFESVSERQNKLKDERNSHQDKAGFGEIETAVLHAFFMPLFVPLFLIIMNFMVFARHGFRHERQLDRSDISLAQQIL